MAITGYNLPHLAHFTEAELQALADILPKGLTYRVYGGEESRTFDQYVKLIGFLTKVEGDEIVVWTAENPMTGGVTEFENELYLFPPPTIWQGIRNWLDFNFNKPKYYRNLARTHFEQFKASGCQIFNLPLKVNQNAGFKAYAQYFLHQDYDFDIDLHLYGGSARDLRANLEWYKENTHKTIHFLEFNGLENERTTGTLQKGTDYHAYKHTSLLETIRRTLGDQCGEILYFTLGANEHTMNWRNPPYLHKYYVGDQVNNTIPTVFP